LVHLLSRNDLFLAGEKNFQKASQLTVRQDPVEATHELLKHLNLKLMQKALSSAVQLNPDLNQDVSNRGKEDEIFPELHRLNIKQVSEWASDLDQIRPYVGCHVITLQLM